MARVLTGDDVMRAAQAAMMRPWVWGEADCCTSVCDMVIALFGHDPMDDIRGAYDSAEGADALIGAYGGFLGIASAMARSVGWLPVSGPVWPGDVGVTAPGVHQPDRRALAMCVGPGAWVCKSPRGLTVVREVDRCWRAP